MTDDLVKRLRVPDPCCEEHHTQNEAADRIEALERELEETQDRANAFATKEYYTEMRAERAEARLAKAVEALRMALTYNTAMHRGAAEFNKRILATLAEIEGGKG